MLDASRLSYATPDGAVLFSDVSLAASPGEAIALCGPSGVGKTTLITVLGGLQPPTGGTVRLEPQSEPPIAWVLQTVNVLPARSALANTMTSSLLTGASSEARRTLAEHALERVGLTSSMHKRARYLSGGELQRVTVARALASPSAVILADEPTSQLDDQTSGLVMGALLGEAEAGRLVVIVTHDLEALPEGFTTYRLTRAGLEYQVR